MKVILSCILSLFIALQVDAQAGRPLSRSEYILLYKEDAIRDMQKMGVPASITMAQALLESSNGNSRLAREANNHFGIKCAEWKGESFIQDDDKKDECFRKYKSVLESYDDHSLFLRNRPRYASLFQLDITDYEGWAKGLKKAGYATDPSYADRLIKIIEDNQLFLLDQQALSGASASASPGVPVYKEEKKPSFFSRISVPAVEVVDPYSSRRIQKNNGVDYIVVRKGDNLKVLAHELGMGQWQLPKYNDLKANSALTEGQILYLKPKKNRGNKAVIEVKSGDSVHSISQEMGIKMKYIYKYNDLKEGQSLRPGQKIYLKKRS